MHRFYVGKIGTGILWLCTFGFLHIGTIIDIICIMTGTFRDKQGRRLLAWWNLNELEKMTPPSASMVTPTTTSARTLVRTPRSLRAVGLAFLGDTIMTLAFFVGLAAAINLPDIVAAGWPDRDLPAELNKLFGYTGWPQLSLKILWVSSSLLLVIGALFTLISRREQGVAHVSRAALGAVAMFASLQMLGQALMYENWSLIVDMFEHSRAGPAIEVFIDAVRSNQAIAAGALIVGFLLLFAWPVRKYSVNDSTGGDQGQGVSS